LAQSGAPSVLVTPSLLITRTALGLHTLRTFGLVNVCFGSLADIEACVLDVRFVPENRHALPRYLSPLCANSGNRRPEIDFAQTPVTAGYRRLMGCEHGSVMARNWSGHLDTRLVTNY
jgi:hypothetical protein